MTIEEKLTSSHENLVDGITVLLLQTLYNNNVIDGDAEANDWYKRVSRDVEGWLRDEYRE